MSGLKFDGGKTPIVSGLIDYFPRSLIAVANVSDYGFRKYGSWGGWISVPDGLRRYTDAMGRHFFDEKRGLLYDPESQMLNPAMTAWNSLARLELGLLSGEFEDRPGVVPPK